LKILIFYHNNYIIIIIIIGETTTTLFGANPSTIPSATFGSTGASFGTGAMPNPNYGTKPSGKTLFGLAMPNSKFSFVPSQEQFNPNPKFCFVPQQEQFIEGFGRPLNGLNSMPPLGPTSQLPIPRLDPVTVLQSKLRNAIDLLQNWYIMLIYNYYFDFLY